MIHNHEVGGSSPPLATMGRILEGILPFFVAFGSGVGFFSRSGDRGFVAYFFYFVYLYYISRMKWGGIIP